MIQLKRVPAAAPLVCLFLVLGCSKTEDVAPERKIFGDPPTIVNFRILNPDGTEATSPSLSPATVQCDFTKVMEDRFCYFGAPGTVADSPVIIGGNYTQVVFEAVVDDPNTARDGTTGRMTQSNLLLVASSFVLPNSTSETTLVLFNDGSANKFPQPQKVQGIGEDCTVDEFGNCLCQGATYLVDSNDPSREDLGNEVFTRAFAFVTRTSSLYLQDCIMRENHQVPYPLDFGDRVKFRIDAVDRQGNLDTWEKIPEIVVGEDSFNCTGDVCACCFITSNDPFSDCPDKPGMRSASYPNGFCVDFL